MRRVLRDPFVLGALALVASALVTYVALPSRGDTVALWAGHLADPAFLLLVLASFVASGRLVPKDAEGRFWLLLFATFTLWLAGSLVSLTGGVLGFPTAAFRVTDILYLASYVTMILAADVRPHVPTDWTRRAIGSGFAPTASVLMVGVIVVYFFVVPEWSDPDRTRLSAQSTFVALDLVLVIRFSHLVYRSRGTAWTSVYAALTASVLFAGIADALNLAVANGSVHFDYGTPLDAFWWGPFVFAIAARRLRAGARSEPRVAADGPDAEPRTDATELLLLYAFALPIAHQSLEVMGFVAANEQRTRELIVLGALLGFIALAVLHQRRLERKNRELHREIRVLVTNEQVLQSQKLEAIGRLAGGLAHDFNNLLTVVEARAEILLGALAPKSPGRGDAEEIRHAADRAAALTRQLLAFSRSQVLRVRSIDLNRSVGEAEAILRRLAGERITLVTRLDPHLSPVEAEPSQVFQVLLNLLANARDAMPDGGRVILSTRDERLEAGDPEVVPPTTGGSFAAVDVTDAGPGIDDATRRRLFEPFFTRKVGGTGLGLAVVYGIASQSGGHVRVRSAPGRGTSFTVMFPYSGRAVTREEPSEGAAAPGSSLERRVLLVEDQPTVRASVREMLLFLGFHVVEAEGGEKAVRACGEAGPFDLLLTDVVMPGMRGPEVAQRVRRLLPGIAVLYMSGFVEADADEEIAADGAAQFLSKPFGLEALRAKIDLATAAAGRAHPA